MIAYLNGEFKVKNPAYFIVECNGVGYQVNISLNTFSKLQTLDKGKIHTYLHVREDAQILYGFADESEKNLFISLISVQGVGTNTARMILSSMSPGDLEEAIRTENDVLIQRIKGVGPKTAKRLVIDLKDKIGKGAGATENSFGFGHNTMKEEALSALAMLGFTRQQGEKAIGSAMKLNPTPTNVESLIKLALKNL
ncbi:MAG TPA: Holliday junction branch migration protein RuvA [Chitinophagales bacterium]|nr:Holliday junction branch migration protein RuvA [Chitinophagales bacterium]HRG29064.1 Holliday junction branch migration protein RuvA [Chitinophagales bacterium]HRG84674.1 Holliday junction branch migration protein RuvA [Chitinophagales bacterium]HRH52419.1 Holliday junction branch migration protein RuvA [Chitinophagales bacterium]